MAKQRPKTGSLEFLRRKYDRTVYAIRCRGCGIARKIYQRPAHTSDCPFFGQKNK